MLKPITLCFALVITAFQFGFGSNQKPVLGIGYVDFALTKGSYYRNIYSNGIKSDAFIQAKTSDFQTQIGGSLVGIILNKKINRFFIGDFSEIGIGGGYGKTHYRNLNSSEIKSSGTVALTYDLKYGFGGMYRLNNSLVFLAKLQWVLQQEFLIFTSLDGNTIHPHRKDLSVSAALGGTRVDAHVYLPYRLTMDSTSKTIHVNKGFGIGVSQRLGEKYYMELTYDRVLLRYISKRPDVFDFENLWKPTWSMLSFKMGMGI